MTNLFATLALWLLPSKVLGVSTGTLVTVAPQIIAGLKAIGVVIRELQKSGKTETEATGAAFEMVAKRRRMTPEEERVWGDRNTLPAN